MPEADALSPVAAMPHTGSSRELAAWGDSMERSALPVAVPSNDSVMAHSTPPVTRIE